MVKTSIDYGINLFDTADVYDAGDSERLLGESLKGYRDQVMIATKVRGRMGEGINETGLSRHHMRIAIRNSLERMGTKWIDIYQYHGWDKAINIDETLDTMQLFVEEGLVNYPGFSNFTSWQMAEFQARVEERGYARYEVAQLNYSLLNRDIEYQELPFMREENLTLLAWSPLHGGVLTGKYKKGEKPPEGTRMGDRGFFFPYFQEEQGWKIVEEVVNIAKEQGAKPSQVALSWIIRQGHVAIIGAKTMDQLIENLESINVNLTREQIDRLNKLSEGRIMYPPWMVERQNQDRKFEII